MTDRLRGRRLLVVEDEYAIATELVCWLEDEGVEVVGPVGTVDEALALVAREAQHLHGAMLDINLHDQLVYPVADALSDVGVPFVFTTGYSASAIPPAYADVPRCMKPLDGAQLRRLIPVRE
ncbi:MAG: response regulator [Acetobacteraceae bacterium]|nr:response regulator [Acetobacteraceae bacterium]